MAMPKTQRHNRKRDVSSPEALAKQLPEDLRNFGTYTDMDKRRDDIVRWINTQRPQQGAALVEPVMVAVGLTYLAGFRDRMRSPQALGEPHGR
jgi:hypothetical protein